MLTPRQRSTLRAQAHRLEPVVIVGAEGLTPSVIAEIERSLAAHELVKIRAGGAEREEREAMLTGICAQTGADPVQHIGKVLVVYRPRPAEPPTKRPAARQPKQRPAKPARKAKAARRPPPRGSRTR